MSGPIRAIMICDLNNPKSVQYTQIARQTFKATKKIEIELWQCVTPETRSKFNRLVWGGKDTRKKYAGQNRILPQAEKACLQSHLYWWFKQAHQDERFLIMEHDAYLRDATKFEALLEQIDEHMIWNCGIAAECYSINRSFARFCDYYYNVARTPISSGPLAEMFHLAQRFYKLMGQVGQPVGRTLWPAERKYTGRPNQLRSAKNPTDCLCRDNKFGLQTAPVTQCHNFDIGNTLEKTLPISQINNPDVEFLDNERFSQILESFHLEQNT